MSIGSMVNFGGTYNVRDFGAIGYDGAAHYTEDTQAFRQAARKCTNRACTIVVPPTMTQNANTNSGHGYNVSYNYLTDMPAGAGCVTELGGLINMDVPLVLPPHHRVVGTCVGSRDAYRGSTIRGTGSLANGTYVVRLGTSGVSCAGARLEDVMVDGNGSGTQALIGVYSNSVQEQSGLRRVKVYACSTGVRFDQVNGVAGTMPNNWILEDVDVNINSGSTGYGVLVQNGQGPSQVSKLTVINNGTVGAGSVGLSMRGSHISAEDIHFEGFDYCIEIGGDAGAQTYYMYIRQASGYNLVTQAAMTALLRIRSTETFNWGVDTQFLSMNQVNGATWIVQDDRNATNRAATLQWVNRHAYNGDNTSSSGTPLAVTTTL